MTPKAWIAVVVGLFLIETDALDTIFETIRCDNSHPVSIVPSTFKITCDGSPRCSFNGKDTALIKGHLILNGVEEAGVEGTTAYMTARLETLAKWYDIVNGGTAVDLCGNENNNDDQNNADDAYNVDDDAYNGDDDAYNGDDDAYNANDDDANANNGDDAYNGDDDAYDDDAYNGDDARLLDGDDAYNGDDAYGANDGDCPDDGVYSFATYVELPRYDGTWMGTGWGANANINMFTYDGDWIGSCSLSFSTQTTGIGPSSKGVITFIFILCGLLLFVGVFIGVRRSGGYHIEDDAREFKRMGDNMVKSTAGAVSPIRRMGNTIRRAAMDALSPRRRTRTVNDSYYDTTSYADTASANGDASTQVTNGTFDTAHSSLAYDAGGSVSTWFGYR